MGRENILFFLDQLEFSRRDFCYENEPTNNVSYTDSVVKNPPANAGDVGSIPGSERSPGAGNGNPLKYSCLGNPMDRRAWRPEVHGVAKESDTM